MKDIPALFIILAIFISGSLGLLIYSKLKPTPMLAAQSIWTVIDETQSQLQDRTLKLSIGQSSERVIEPFFKCVVKRLENVVHQERTYGRYVTQITLMQELPRQKTFAQGGAEIGFVDQDPEEYKGNVSLVAFRKLDTQVH